MVGEGLGGAQSGGENDPVRRAVLRRINLLERAAQADAEQATGVDVTIPAPYETQDDYELAGGTLMFSAAWPDGQHVSVDDKAGFERWRADGEPDDWESYRQGDYDLAARTVPGPTDAKRRHGAQDDDATAPDPEGPEAGA